MTKQQAFAPSWGLLLFRGILAVIFGIFAISNPAITTIWLLRVFAIFLFIDAIFLLFGLVAGKIKSGANWLLWIRGIIGLIAGVVIVFTRPVEGTLILGLTIAMLMGIQAMIIGIFEFFAGLKARKEEGWWAVLLGMIWVTFGASFLASPAVSMFTLTWVAGIFGIVLGVASIILSFQIKKAIKT